MASFERYKPADGSDRDSQPSQWRITLRPDLLLAFSLVCRSGREPHGPLPRGPIRTQPDGPCARRASRRCSCPLWFATRACAPWQLLDGAAGGAAPSTGRRFTAYCYDAGPPPRRRWQRWSASWACASSSAFACRASGPRWRAVTLGIDTAQPAECSNRAGGKRQSRWPPSGSAAAALRLGATPRPRRPSCRPAAGSTKPSPGAHRRPGGSSDSCCRSCSATARRGVLPRAALLPASYVFKPLQPDEPVIMASTRHPQPNAPGRRARRSKGFTLGVAHRHHRRARIFEREVLAALPDTLQFQCRPSLPVFASLLNQPDAVALVPGALRRLPSGARSCASWMQLSSPSPVGRGAPARANTRHADPG